jgi:glycosyltransferase involved in cell wall biosynthesis
MTQKTKILMLCDHPLSTSGVGTQARYLINGLIETGKYTFKVFGGAMKHENYNVITPMPDLVIKPTDGFGDKYTLRKALAQERPDVLLLFTDPRFFIWVWEIEDEIHQVCPIAYNHLWDNEPWPEFNRVLYESTDLLNCINWPTYKMLKERFPEKTNYIPHAVPPDLFFPMKEQEIRAARQKYVGTKRMDHVVYTYVSRNARRKLPNDILYSFKMLLDRLQEKYGHKKATLLMHTNPLDNEGPNLLATIEMLEIGDNVVFSNNLVDFPEMNRIYNASDVIVNRSIAEGFGLGTLEGMMTGKPMVVVKTGGLTRQVEDPETGEQFGVGIDPEVKSLTGHQSVPFIWEDYVSHETYTNALMTVYEWGPEKRAQVGSRARERALREYDIKKMIRDWDSSLTNLLSTWSVDKHERYELRSV